MTKNSTAIVLIIAMTAGVVSLFMSVWVTNGTRTEWIITSAICWFLSLFFYGMLHKDDIK